jgi:hypothetical protein
LSSREKKGKEEGEGRGKKKEKKKPGSAPRRTDLDATLLCISN